jgi:hypothetical protein
MQQLHYKKPSSKPLKIQKQELTDTNIIPAETLNALNKAKRSFKNQIKQEKKK